MTDDISFEVGSDPLHRDTPFDHVTTIPVLGIPTRYRTNAPAILAAVEDAFGSWRVLEDHPHLIREDLATVTLAVHEGEEDPRDVGVRFRSLDGRRVLLATRGSQAVVEPLRRDALGWVTPTLVADRAHFRYNVLESLTLGLLSTLDRSPLHAAAVVRNGAALLLVGPSGAGKSTLTYAAARAGLSVLCEDVAHVQLRPGLRIWGMSSFLHLTASARRFFPELRGRDPVLLANGKEKVVVDLRKLGAAATLPVVDRAGVCLLGRSSKIAEPYTESLTRETLLAEMGTGSEPGFDTYRETVREGVEMLAERGGWRLVVGPDPSAAVGLLEEMLGKI